jgi:putative membrane protein
MGPLHFHPHVGAEVVIAALVTGYAWVLARGRQPVPRVSVVSFAVATATLWVVSDFPVQDLAEHYLFSVHAVQHLLLVGVVAPLLLLAVPRWLFDRWLVEPVRVRRALFLLTKPVVAVVVFNALLVLTNLPVVTDASSRNGWIHAEAHALMLAGAMVFWLPVVNRSPSLPRLTHAQRMVYLVVQSIVPAIPASFLTFSDGLLYRAYVGRAEQLGVSAVTDQQIGGAVLKIGGGLLLWVVLAWVFFRWFAEDGAPAGGRRIDGPTGGDEPDPAELADEGASDRLPEVLTWEDVEQAWDGTPPRRPS